MATFFTQITMLNMLIAIMADTYDMITEKKFTYSMKTKLEIMNEYTRIIKYLSKDPDLFLFIIKTNDEEVIMDDWLAWQGGFNFLKDHVSD